MQWFLVHFLCFVIYKILSGFVIGKIFKRFLQLELVFRSPPASLMAILSTCEELCDNILSGIQVGEFAVVQPLSVEYSCILGYLLSWKLLLTFFKSSSSHVSHKMEF